MQKLNKNEVGLVTGGFLALFHFVWLVLVGFGWAKGILDFILKLHHLSFSYSVLAFSWSYAVGLIVVTAIIGYICGWAFAAIWNSLRK